MGQREREQQPGVIGRLLHGLQHAAGFGHQGEVGAVERADAYVAEVRARTDAGLLPPNDLLSAQAQRAREAVRLVQARNAASVASMRLARLIGEDPVRPIEPLTAVTVRMWPYDRINGLFEATIDATEEAIVNAMVAAEPMTGADGYRVHALPTDQVVKLLKRAGRIQ